MHPKALCGILTSIEGHLWCRKCLGKEGHIVSTVSLSLVTSVGVALHFCQSLHNSSRPLICLKLVKHNSREIHMASLKHVQNTWRHFRRSLERLTQQLCTTDVRYFHSSRVKSSFHPLPPSWEMVRPAGLASFGPAAQE